MLFSVRVSKYISLARMLCIKVISLARMLGIKVDYAAPRLFLLCCPYYLFSPKTLTHSLPNYPLFLRCIGISPLIIHGIIWLCCMYAQLNNSHPVSLSQSVSCCEKTPRPRRLINEGIYLRGLLAILEAQFITIMAGRMGTYMAAESYILIYRQRERKSRRERDIMRERKR